MDLRDDAKLSCFFHFFPAESLFVELNRVFEVPNSIAPARRHVSCWALVVRN
jgi:hypothetical protein